MKKRKAESTLEEIIVVNQDKYDYTVFPVFADFFAGTRIISDFEAAEAKKLKYLRWEVWAKIGRAFIIGKPAVKGIDCKPNLKLRFLQVLIRRPKGMELITLQMFNYLKENFPHETLIRKSDKVAFQRIMSIIG